MGSQSLTIRGDEEAVQAAFARIHSTDKAAEKEKKIGCFLIVVGVLLGFLGVQAEGSPPLALTLVVLAGVGLLVGVVRYSRGNSADIEDARYEQVVRLHKFLALDCEKESEFEYDVNLRAYDDSAYYLRQKKFGRMLFLPRGSIAYYRMPLLTSKVRLRDGTMINIAVDRATAKKTVTKRGLSGKTKTKVKMKYRDIYRIRIKVPEGMMHPPRKLKLAPQEQLDQVYKASGPKASVVYVRKGGNGRVPDLDILLKLLCLVFFSIHQERHRTA